MWTIIFPNQLYQKLERYLFKDKSTENGCFLLARHYQKSKDKSAILVREILPADNNSWNRKGPSTLEPTSAYINQCVIKADSSNSMLIFVHSHPLAIHPPVFSPIDNETNAALFANLSEILTDKPISSIVLSSHGLYGDVFFKGKTDRIAETKIIGETIKYVNTVGAKKKQWAAQEELDRQVKAIGLTTQQKLQSFTVSIVGLGGVGAPVAIQLARMGVGTLRLIDSDVIDKSNLSRVYGSTPKDVGEPKVSVVAKHIKTFSSTKVIPIIADITKTDTAIINDLTDSDVIFGCTDTLSSRAVLNDLCVRRYIPLIDSGCRIHLNGLDKSIEQAIAIVQVVTPDSACLWCTGVLDGNLILQESFSPEERQKLANEGYAQPVESQPSIISLTTLAASLAVNKLLCLLGLFGEDYSTRTHIELVNDVMIKDRPDVWIPAFVKYTKAWREP
jgi:predicted ThiF/HesA family dinucleotide-utilizing enzyme